MALSQCVICFTDLAGECKAQFTEEGEMVMMHADVQLIVRAQ